MMTTQPTTKQRTFNEIRGLLAESFTYYNAQWGHYDYSMSLPQSGQTIQMLGLKEQQASQICETEELGFELLFTRNMTYTTNQRHETPTPTHCFPLIPGGKYVQQA